MTYPHQRLNRFLKLNDLIKRLESEREKIRQEILSSKEPFPSTYNVSIAAYTVKRLESLEAIRDKSQKLFDALISAGCVNEIEQTRVMVKRNLNNKDS